MTLRRGPLACRDAAWRSQGLGGHQPLGIDTGQPNLPQMLRAQRAGPSRFSDGRQCKIMLRYESPAILRSLCRAPRFDRYHRVIS